MDIPDGFRLCLRCRGTGFVYDYYRFKYISKFCNCCKNGVVPVDSADDGFGEIEIVQHAWTTEIFRAGKSIGKTADLYLDVQIEDMVVRLNGLFTPAEMTALTTLFRLARKQPKKITCSCCNF